MAKYLTARGVDESRVLLEEQASDTRENLEFSRTLAQAHGMRTDRVLIITSDFHLCRAKYLAKKLGMEPYGLASRTSPEVLRVNYLLREVFAFVKAALCVFAAVRGGRRQFQLAVPCQPGGFDPTLLICEKKRGVEPPRRSRPKEPLGRGSSGRFPKQKGLLPLRLPGAARYRNLSSRAMLRTFERSLVGGTTDLLDPTRRKANFLWKFLCAGAAIPDCAGDPIPTAVPPQGFLQSKNALRRRRLPNLLLGSLIVE